MADYAMLLDAGAGQLGLKDDLDLIRGLVEVAKKWRDIADEAEIDGVGSASELFSKLVADFGSDKVKGAFERVGLANEHASLKRLLAKAQEIEGSVPEKYKKLLEPLSKYASAAADEGQVAWSVVGKRDLDAGGEFKFGFNAKAGIVFEAGDKIKFAEGEERRLLKIGTDAKVGATGSGKLPFSLGSVGGGAEAGVNAALAYYFKPADEGQLYAVAVAERLTKLPNPYDYGAVWRAFASGELGLEAITYTIDGIAKANVEISFADTASFGTKLSAELKMSVSAEASIKSEYSLHLIGAAAAGAGGRKIRAVLTRKKRSDAQLGLELGVDLDLSKLAQRVHAIFKRAVDKWDEALKAVTPFLSPGTYLQSQLGELLNEQAERLIGDAELRQALVKDLRGAIGIDTSSDAALAGWLSGEIAGAIDSVSGTLTSPVHDAAGRVAEALKRRLPAAFGGGDAAAKIQGAAESLLGKVDGELRQTVQSLLLEPGNALGRALKEAGARSTDVVAGLDDALKSVRELIKKYDALIHKALAVAGDEAKAKITARIRAEEKRSDETNYLIVGTFDSPGDAAGKVFYALTRGTPADLRGLLAHDVPGDGFELDAGRSSLRRWSERLSKVGYDVVLFGLEVSGSTLVMGNAAIVVDGTGKVRVDTKGGAERKFESREEGREVTFVDTFSLLRAKLAAPGAGERAIDLGVSVIHKDKSLKLGEMRGFVESLSERNLLPAGSVAAATAHFTRWAGSDDKKARLIADIAAKLWLDKPQAEALMMLGERNADGTLQRSAALRIARTAIAALVETKAVSKKRLTDAAAHVREHMYRPGYPHAGLADIVLDMKVRGDGGELFDTWKHLLPTGDERFRSDVSRLIERESKQVNALVALIETLGRIYLAQPSGNEPSRLGWDENKYRRAQFELAGHAAGWLRTGQEWLFWAAREVQPWTVALLCTVADLARGSRAGAMSLNLTRRNDQGERLEQVEIA
jgi:hypothetical protein